MTSDRRAILERRRRFVAATLAALSGSMTAACPAPPPAVTPLGHGTPPGAPRITGSAGASAGGASGDVGTAGAAGASGSGGATHATPPDLAELDSDGDGVPDARDACPELSGVSAVGSTRDGCPRQPCLSVVPFSNIEITHKIHFASGEARLPPASRPLLSEIARMLLDQDLLELDVVGHCDSTEPDALAELRAKRVRDALVAEGVAPTRLVAVGKGAREPIDTNATEEGRRNNRRVEFLVRGARRP